MTHNQLTIKSNILMSSVSPTLRAMLAQRSKAALKARVARTDEERIAAIGQVLEVEANIKSLLYI